MTNDKQEQLIVQFGKYNGKPVELLLQDQSYVQWLSGQGWFPEKYPSINNLIVNNYYPQPIETPEHNQMQVKFINKEHALKLAYLASISKLFECNNSHFKSIFIKFVDELSKHRVNLSSIIDGFENLDGTSLINVSNIVFEEKGIDVKYDVTYGYDEFGIPEDVFRQAANVFNLFWRNASCRMRMRVELKPDIGDDFPAVLRQIKKNRCNILVIRNYTGSGATFEEFKQFFITQDIQIFEEKEIEQTVVPDFEKVFIFDKESKEYINNKIKNRD